MKNRFRTALNQSKWLVLVALILLAVFPLFVKSPYILRVATTALINIMLTLGLNVVTGYMGQTSFGMAAFWGIGAYVAAILSTRFGIGTELLVILSPLVAGFLAFLLGLCVLKLKGYYMAIVTLGFCEVVRLVELNWMSLTRGPMGITNLSLIHI